MGHSAYHFSLTWLFSLGLHSVVCFLEAKASVTAASNKVGEWVIEYVIFLHGLSNGGRKIDTILLILSEFNLLKCSGVRLLHLKVFSAIQV